MFTRTRTIRPVLRLTLVGGPTALLGYGGLRWLTDPALSPPGEYTGGLVKTTGPALSADEIGPVDVVLLSHDHHSDNLDPAGRELLPRAGRVLTTVEGAARLGGNAAGLSPWSEVEVAAPDGPPVTVTAVPAQHGPNGSEPVMGQVIGFVLARAGLESVYVSGDNASLDVVRSIADRFAPVDVAVLFAGAVQLAHRFDGAYLTLSSDRAAEAAKLLGVRAAIPVHFEGWTHFTQGAPELRAAFAGNGVGDRLVLPERGETVTA
jgi:L-ascorbate metabolism protein UlaG (beta-lactamase superfamily)